MSFSRRPLARKWNLIRPQLSSKLITSSTTYQKKSRKTSSHTLAFVSALLKKGGFIAPMNSELRHILERLSLHDLQAILHFTYMTAAFYYTRMASIYDTPAHWVRLSHWVCYASIR